jgi:hypothetical protein
MKQFFKIILTIALFSMGMQVTVFAATPGQSITTNTSNNQYYNNNAAANPLLNTAWQANAAKFPGWSPELKALQKEKWLTPDWLIWNDTAKLLNWYVALTTTPQNWGGTTATTNTNSSKENVLGIEWGRLRQWDVDMNTIPLIIVSVIETLLAVAGTVAIFSLIYHAVQMQINSGITGDSSGVDKAKKGMIGALIGFVIAISAWFLVTQAVALLGAAT